MSSWRDSRGEGGSRGSRDSRGSRGRTHKLIPCISFSTLSNLCDFKSGSSSTLPLNFGAFALGFPDLLPGQ